MRPAREAFTAGAVLAALGAALTAWHAHGLRAALDPEAYQAVGRALMMQFQGSAGLMACGLLGERARPAWGGAAAASLGLGTLLFSGSVLLRHLAGWEAATRVAPLGGSLQILGWLLLAAAVLGRRKGWSRHPDSNRG